MRRNRMRARRLEEVGGGMRATTTRESIDLSKRERVRISQKRRHAQSRQSFRPPRGEEERRRERESCSQTARTPCAEESGLRSPSIVVVETEGVFATTVVTTSAVSPSTLLPVSLPSSVCVRPDDLP